MLRSIDCVEAIKPRRKQQKKMITITINAYTGNWQSAIPQSSLRPGTLVRVHDRPDGREIDDFRRALRRQGLEIDLGDSLRRFPRLEMDLYRIRVARSEEGEL